MRLIDADALGVGYCNPLVFDKEEYAHGWNCAIEIIEKAPTIDAVEVVRCKDCTAFEQTFYNGVYCGGYCYHWDYEPGESPNSVDGDDYCSYGERKTT